MVNESVPWRFPSTAVTTPTTSIRSGMVLVVVVGSLDVVAVGWAVVVGV
jgi:hypothetical protein